MIKKLRLRIIFINMVLIGIVILGIFTAVTLNQYSNSIHALEHSMERLLDDGTRTGGEPKDGGFDGGKDMKPRFRKEGMDGEQPVEISSYIIVSVDSSGRQTDRQEVNVTMDEDDLADCIAQATANSGQLTEYSLMYVARETPDGRAVILADNSSIYRSLRSSLLISASLFFASLAVIFVISLFLSGLAVKPVQKAWEQQKQFVADASHELKTPLTVILANNNIMLSHPDSTVREERQWLESTGEEADHMKRLIDEMLFLAKSDAGTEKLEFSEVDLSQITEGCALNFEPVAFEKNVMIDAVIEPDVTVTGNATQLNQLVHILTDNAVKYAENGSTVRISLERQGGQARLSVNNRGSEMTPEELEHVFDRFYRAEKSRTTKGYGLGLSIAQKIVQSMGGKITAESGKEAGTTFKVELRVES